MREYASKSKAMLDNIDRVLAAGPSSDTDYGFGRPAERCLRDGLCWRCMKADAVDEMGEVGLCQLCLDLLRWEPPEAEPVHEWECSDACRCRERLASLCFDALRKAQRPTEPGRVGLIRRAWRALARELRSR